VLLPSGGSASGFALVVPFRQSTLSAYQVSSSFQLRRLPGLAWAKLPVPAAAKRTPGLPFDDFVGECSTATRLANPQGLHVTSDGRVKAFGTECNRDDQSLASVVETWAPGASGSSIERLPFARADRLLRVQIKGDTDIWAAQAFGLIHFDGQSWKEIPLPAGLTALSAFSVSAVGTVWLVTNDAQLWEQRVGQEWERRTTSMIAGPVRDLFADGADELWVASEAALLSTRPLPAGELCASPCEEYWQESLRRSRIPHGD
jgi:hypothetical protein